MSGPGGRFDPSELRSPGEPEPSAAELADALVAARELEAMAATEGIRPTEGFADRVMTAIASEPAPRLVVQPRTVARGGRPAALLVALRDAWGVASSGGRPLAVRAQALGFVLLAVLIVGSLTGVAAIGVGGLLGPHPSPTSLPVPTTSPIPSHRAPLAPSPSPSPEATTEPGGSSEPSDSAEPAETPHATETPEPTETPERGTARPTRTRRPGETPEPTETPEASDDHGGGGSDDPKSSNDHGGGNGGGG